MSQFQILSTDTNGEIVVRTTLDPTTNVRRDGTPNPKPDTPVGAMRAYGCAHVRKDGSTIGSRTGRKIWAVPMEIDGEDATMEPTAAPRKRISAKKNKSVVNDAPTADAPYGYDSDGTPLAPYGYKLDGTPAKQRGRKAGQTAAVIRDENLAEKVSAPYGFKKDGVTPKARPGRKGNVQSDSPAPPSTNGAKAIAAKSVDTDEFVSALNEFIRRNGMPTKKEMAKLVRRYS